MQHRKLSIHFSIKENINILLCKIFGHRINEDPANHWCERCSLPYDRCYQPKDYFAESGLSAIPPVEHDFKITKPTGDIEFVTVVDEPKQVAEFFLKSIYSNCKIEYLEDYFGLSKHQQKQFFKTI